MSDTPKREVSDIKYNVETLAIEAQSHIDKFRKQMKDIAEECLGEIYADITPYIETDTWTNYREALRIELQHEYKYSKFKEPWATDFRRAVFVENREEISKLIEADILNRIKHLEDCRQEFDQYCYSPGGDRYQDKVKELESEREKLAICVEALEFYQQAFDMRPASSMMGDYRPFNIDRGAKAREALAQIEELKK